MPAPSSASGKRSEMGGVAAANNQTVFCVVVRTSFTCGHRPRKPSGQPCAECSSAWQHRYVCNHNLRLPRQRGHQPRTLRLVAGFVVSDAEDSKGVSHTAIMARWCGRRSPLIKSTYDWDCWAAELAVPDGCEPVERCMSGWLATFLQAIPS